MSLPLPTVTASLERIARAAGADLRERFHRPRTVEMKGEIDLVTDADRAAEAIILEQLHREYPKASVLAEESGAVGDVRANELTFIVDPLDGTTNYAHGIPHFCVTIAARDASGVASGVVYDPLRDEMYAATRGGGAYCNGTRLRVTETAALKEAVLSTGFPYDVHSRPDEILSFFSAFIRRSRAVRRFGSAALDLAYVAQGRYDGYWERGLKPWDMAAGVLLVTEAGGTVSNYQGAPAKLDLGECIASNARLWTAMVAVTREVEAAR
jgi:myo-inositol-1(or 4)-monophosphatase